MSTPYMGLVLPTPTVTAGPLYATENNTAFETIDAHDHSPGKGAPVPTAGLSINADLPFGGFNATALRSSRMANNNSPLSNPADLVCLYASAGNLYWNNQAGQQIQLTAGGALNAASVGGIGGDYSTSSASVFYTTSTTKFTFWQGANISALMDQGATTIRDTGASAKGVTLLAPSGLAANYSLTFPSALPGATKIMSIDSTGAIGAVYDVDNSSLEISSNTFRVKDGGITTAKLADGAVTPVKLSGFTTASGTGGGTTTSTVYVDVVSASALTCSGLRPVEIQLQAANTADCFISLSTSTAGTNIQLWIKLVRDSTDLAVWFYQATSNSGSFNANITDAITAIKYIDFSPTAGSVVYKLQAKVGGVGATTTIGSSAKLWVFEKV